MLLGQFHCKSKAIFNEIWSIFSNISKYSIISNSKHPILFFFVEQIGLIYIFNLIVGTGALTMPGAFHSAGWLLSLITIIILGFMRFVEE